MRFDFLKSLLYVLFACIPSLGTTNNSYITDVRVEDVDKELPESKLVIARGGVSASLLRIVRDSTNRSTIAFHGENMYSMGVDSLGNFSISSQEVPMIVIDTNQTIHMHIPTLSVKNVDLGGDFRVQGVSQFRMIWREDFSDAKGWTGTVSKMGVSTCSGIQMLGGYKLFGRGWVKKTFIELPVHKELRIKGTFHFIDQWAGEHGYMKLTLTPSSPLEYVWTDRHFHKDGSSGINICGEGSADGKFAVPVEVTVPHTFERFTISFGSTLEGDAVQKSWGISGLEIHIR